MSLGSSRKPPFLLQTAGRPPQPGGGGASPDRAKREAWVVALRQDPGRVRYTARFSRDARLPWPQSICVLVSLPLRVEECHAKAPAQAGQPHSAAGVPSRRRSGGSRGTARRGAPGTSASVASVLGEGRRVDDKRRGAALGSSRCKCGGCVRPRLG